jgi:7-cyano-7-deazaguanine synthase
MTNSALVLFSGGQDSTTCLAWALNRYDHVETLGFDYGQRHAIELTMRPQLLDSLRAMRSDWKSKLGEDHVLDLSLLAAISDTALTSDVAITMQENGLPNTFVPGRNLLFLTSAAALAYRRGINDLVGGMCETDYSGYPDCRDETLRSLEQAINLGMASKLAIQTPLMWLNKAQSWQLAATLGGQELVELIRTETHTCYLGERGVLHAWGHGCGSCPACELRARGYADYLAKK